MFQMLVSEVVYLEIVTYMIVSHQLPDAWVKMLIDLIEIDIDIEGSW